MTAYRYLRTGRLPATKVGGEWQVDPGDVERLRPGPVPRGGRRRAWARGRLQDRLLAGDEIGAWSIVEAALASGADPSEVHLELLGRALRAIGDGWASGELDVADEHRASAVARRLVARLGPRFARRGRKLGTVVVGAPPGELHDLPVAMVADHLRGAGFDVVDLGASTPASSFALAAERSRPVAVLIGMTGKGHDAAARSVIASVRRAGASTVLVGGAAVPTAEAAAALGADGWSGLDAASAVAAVKDVAGR